MKSLRVILLVVAVVSSPATNACPGFAPDPDTMAPNSSASSALLPDSTRELEQLRSFAESLLREGQYSSAAVEFQRCLVNLPDSQHQGKEYMWLRAAESYRLARRYDLAIRQLDSLMVWPDVTDSTRCRANIARARCFHDQGMHGASLRVLEQGSGFGKAGAEWPDVRGDRSILLTAQHLHIRQWNAAAVSAADVTLGSSDATQLRSLQVLRTLAERGRKMRGPRPLLAGTLSAMIPGAGKVYAGRTAEGIYAFILNGLAIWQSIDGFRDDGTSSVKGWTVGAVGLVLYLGNVYGSVVTAETVGDRQFDDLVDEVDRTVDRGMSR
jgi:TM2 domain-containing membrane protein YozV